METRTSMTSIYPSSLSNIRMTIIIIQSNIFLLVSCSKLGLPFSTGQLIDDGPCIHILVSGNLRLPETLESGPFFMDMKRAIWKYLCLGFYLL